jgi:hypothetical protein
MKKILVVLLIVGLLMAPIALADQVDEECSLDNGEFSEDEFTEQTPNPAPCGGGEGGGGGGGTPG